MRIFISHKQEDSYVANQIASELKALNVEYYLDLLDSSIEKSGRELTNHIRKNLNSCTDIIVVMSEITRLSQWVPFEIGMAAQIDMPTATFLKGDVILPDFLQYWPRLKQPEDILKYVLAKNQVDREYASYRPVYENAIFQKQRTERFYDVLKGKL